MHENIRGALAAGQEAKAAQPVEPLDLSSDQSAGRRHTHVSTRRQHLGRVDRRGLIHRNDSERLIALRPLGALANNARALIGGLVAITAQDGHVQQHIGRAVIRNDEAVALGSIEPFDDAADFDKVCAIAETEWIDRGTAMGIRECLGAPPTRNAHLPGQPLCLKSVRPHDSGPRTSLNTDDHTRDVTSKRIHQHE